MIQIIPAILSTTESDFGSDIKRCNDSGLLQSGWVHIDFMDNLFVPNQSITPEATGKYETKLTKEAHLMVKNPLDWLNQTADAGFKRIFIHIEAEQLAVCLDKIKENRLEVGMVLNPETPIEKLVPFLDKLDRVLLMGIHPGFQGQELLPQVIEKIKQTSHLRAKNNNTFKIGVDGGVRDENSKELILAGADFLVSGSFLLKGDIDANLEKIWEKVSG